MFRGREVGAEERQGGGETNCNQTDGNPRCWVATIQSTEQSSYFPLGKIWSLRAKEEVNNAGSQCRVCCHQHLSWRMSDPVRPPWHPTGSDTACVEFKRPKHFPKENLSPPDHKSQTTLKRSCSTRWQKPLKRLGNFKTYSKETAFTQNQALEANYTASSTLARTEGLPEYQALWDQALGEGQGPAASCQCPQGTLPKPGWFPIITQRPPTAISSPAHDGSHPIACFFCVQVSEWEHRLQRFRKHLVSAKIKIPQAWLSRLTPSSTPLPSFFQLHHAKIIVKWVGLWASEG